MQIKKLVRLLNLLIVLLLVLNTSEAVLAASQATLPQASILTFKPVADAYVIQTNPDTNYGSSTSLRVDISPTTRSYLRFVVSGLGGGTIQSAILRIHANSSNKTGLSVSTEPENSWTEKGITFNNSPSTGTVISISKAVSGGTWVAIDVSSTIKGEGTFSLVLTTASSTNTNLSSREAGANAPQLVVTAGSQGGTTPVPQPTTPAPTNTPTNPGGTSWQPGFPIRAAFYYPWFPEAWTQKGINPYSNYTPQLGYYSSTDPNILKQHIAMMQYANIQAGIASWWGQGSQTDSKIPGLLSAAAGTNFRWALYYENESQGNPSSTQIQNDLSYILSHYAQNPAYLRVNGKFVVFVYADVSDGCGMADRWKQANTVGAYVVLKVFPGYTSCASQPDSWHQYAPATPADQQGSYSYSISPGFWLMGTSERLGRDINRWAQNVRDMAASGANWQLITTFSEWGEGTVVEPGTLWESASGYGQYLDLLHSNGK